jgi:hypothetical protein
MAWALARKVSMPTLNTTMLPSLQVALIKEPMESYGDANTGQIKMQSMAQIGIVVLRAFDDPLVLDGQADRDLDNILDTLFNDNTFTNKDIITDPTQTSNPFYWESCPRIDNQRRLVKEAETYLIELGLLLTFSYPLSWSPPAPNWLEEMDVTVSQAVEAFGPAAVANAQFQLGQINYRVTGPSGGVHGEASASFTVTLEYGATFTGVQSIILSDNGAGGIFVPSYGAPGIGSVVITPPNGQVFFTFTYAAAMVGSVSLVFMDAQDWIDPAPIIFTAT